MKKAVITLLIATTLFCGYKLKTQTYETKGIVTEVIQPCKEYHEGLVIFVDKNGNEWSFEGSEDWFEYDTITVKMSDNGTEWIEDDEILETTYTGYVCELLVNKMSISELIY